MVVVTNLTYLFNPYSAFNVLFSPKIRQENRLCAQLLAGLASCSEHRTLMVWFAGGVFVNKIWMPVLVGLTGLSVLVLEWHVAPKQSVVVSPTFSPTSDHRAAGNGKNDTPAPDVPVAGSAPESIATGESTAQPTTPATTGNPAANFEALPVAMQQDIRQLSGRDQAQRTPVEIKPGVFLLAAGQGPRVVPVAVMNEDGTVSIHEY